MFRALPGHIWRLMKEYARALLIIIPFAFFIRTFGYGLYRVPTGSMEPTMLVGERFFADKFSILFNPIERADVITFNDPSFAYSDNSLIYMLQRYVVGPRNITKRVIGVPGDRVRGVIEQGKPVMYLNEKKADESYVNQYPLVPINPHADIWRSYDPSAPFCEQPFYNMCEHDVQEAQKWYQRRGRLPIRYPQTPLLEGQGSDLFDLRLGENQYWVMGDNRLGSFDSRAFGPLDGKYIHGRILYRLWSIDSESHWWFLDLLFNPFGCWKKFRWQRSFQRV